MVSQMYILHIVVVLIPSQQKMAGVYTSANSEQTYAKVTVSRIKQQHLRAGTRHHDRKLRKEMVY